jgi:hypothetical protein
MENLAQASNLVSSLHRHGMLLYISTIRFSQLTV